MGNPAYATTTHTKRKSWTIIGMFCIPSCISPHPYSTGCPNYIRVLTYNSAILLGLPNDPQTVFPNYLHTFLSAIRAGFNSYCETSYPSCG